ncbi:unnamed protein product [Amoebophrya sp. A25]|nr:unnamed protein product [Amoebophrya sp. A25]|eukprot:GSA25T00018026001.1
MCDPQEYFDRALATLQVASGFEEEGNALKAFHEYMHGLELMQLGFKYSKNERAKPLYRQKMVEILKRAEELKKIIDSGGSILAKFSSSTSSGNLALAGGGGTRGGQEQGQGASSSGPGASSSRGPGPGGAQATRSKQQDELLATLSGAIVIDTPNVKWEDISGLEEAKRTLRLTTELPLDFPHLYTHGKSQLVPWKAILLYGPPGTGKTFLAKAVASSTAPAEERKNSKDDHGWKNTWEPYFGRGGRGQDHAKKPASTFLSVSAADLMCKFVGDSPKLVKTLFELAREKAPSVVFLDEIDSLVQKRSDSDNRSESSRQVLTEFLTQMDGVGPSVEGVLVIGATNTPWELDRAILSRFQKKILIPLPDVAARKDLLARCLKKERCEDGLNVAQHAPLLQSLVEATENFSGRDLKALVLQALQECVSEFWVASKWVVLVPHPFDEQLDYALEPIIAGGEVDGSGTAPQSGVQSCSFDDLRQDENMRKRTILPRLRVRHMQRALQLIKASCGAEDLKQFEDWTRAYGTSGV